MTVSRTTRLGIGLVAVALGLSADLCCLAAPQTSLQFEKPTALRASQVLAPNLLKGPYHSVEPTVTNDGYFNNYTIKSQFGTFVVEGQILLETRIGELVALAELDKLSSSSVFADAAYKAGKGIVLAPVHIVKKTAQTVSDPQKMADTLSAVPEGAEKLFSWVYRKGKSAAHAVGDAFASSSSDTAKKDQDSSSEKSTSEAVSDTLDQGASFGLKYLGYTKRQREWFRKLKINPYTSNELLRDEVMRVAGIETAVGTAFRFVPGLGLLGELNTFNMWYQRAEKLSLYEDPESIGKKNQKELMSLGVPEEIIKRFADNKAYTPWSRRFISASLTAVGNTVTGHTEFIRAACEATNEPSTLYFVSVADAFEKQHSKKRLKRIVASTLLPAAVTEDGTLLLPLSVDYLFWTQEVAGIFKDFQTQVIKPSRASRVHIAVRGRVSKRARAALEAFGATVEEGWTGFTATE
jgi:hypothetical protein